LQNIKPVADEKGVTLAQLVINWTLNQPGVKCVLVGARNKHQVVENIKACELHLNQEEFNFINQELNKLELKL